MINSFSDNFVPHITCCSFQKCNPGWRIWQRHIEDHDLTYIIKGKAHYTINGITHELESGDILYLTEGDIKEAVTCPRNMTQYYAINFSPGYLPKKIGGIGKTDSGRRITGNESILFPMVSHIGIRQDILDLFREMTISWNGQQNGYIMKTSALFMLILNRLSEIILNDVDSTPGDYRVSRIIRYISIHYAEKLMVKNLARQVNLDENYFGHLFKRETGMTVHQYITKTRIRNAENMLQGGGYKIHEVAERCGFCDVFHFYKSFKTLRGFPPSRCIPRK